MSLSIPADSTLDIVDDVPSGSHFVVLRTPHGEVPLAEHGRKEDALAHAAVLTDAFLWEPLPENPEQCRLFP